MGFATHREEDRLLYGNGLAEMECRPYHWEANKIDVPDTMTKPAWQQY
ncbi:hypothetical protein [Photobacterium alginatilyticum]|nr:hypothetical protein [Photobacterium alginatilyticum]